MPAASRARFFGAFVAATAATAVLAAGPLAPAMAQAAAAPVAAPSAAAIDTIARQAILIDMNTDTVLYEKNADERMPTSSMAKMMTLYLIYEALAKGRIKLTDTFPVSEKAWRMGGSKMFVELGKQIPIEDLIQGVTVDSGNDAAIVLAEGLAGSEEAFVKLMNQKAKQLGMTNTHFADCTGWPAPDHYSTARDLAVLAEHLIRDFPQYYHYDAEETFTYHGIKQGNRNPLLYRNMGVDGLKTGHTEAGGYGLAASALRDGRRLLLVINGLPSMQSRADEPAKLIDWGYNDFEDRTLFKAGQQVETAPVWLGAQPTVPLVTARDVTETVPRGGSKDLKVSVEMPAAVPAPIKKGAEIAKLVIAMPGVSPKTVPLYAGADVGKIGTVGRIVAVARHLVLGGGH